MNAKEARELTNKVNKVDVSGILRKVESEAAEGYGSITHNGYLEDAEICALKTLGYVVETINHYGYTISW